MSLDIELTPYEAWFLAQFTKMADLQTFRARTQSDAEAIAMLDAAVKLTDALERWAYNPSKNATRPSLNSDERERLTTFLEHLEDLTNQLARSNSQAASYSDMSRWLNEVRPVFASLLAPITEARPLG